LCEKLWKALHRDSFSSLANLNKAAVGLRAHSGWTALVALFLDKGTPVVLLRRRVHLVEKFTYQFRQPYHTAKKMPLRQGRDFVTQAKAEARRLACRLIRSVESDLKELGFELRQSSLVLSSAKPLPTLEKILVSHALIHTADGELFRQALAQASQRYGLAVTRIRERELLDLAGEALRLRPDEVLRRVTALGHGIGPPWSQDEKFATIAAWLALVGAKLPC
jgi:hypothetical protein